MTVSTSVTHWAESLPGLSYQPPDPAPVKRRFWICIGLATGISTALAVACGHVMYYQPEEPVRVVILKNTLVADIPPAEVEATVSKPHTSSPVSKLVMAPPRSLRSPDIAKLRNPQQNHQVPQVPMASSHAASTEAIKSDSSSAVAAVMKPQVTQVTSSSMNSTSSPAIPLPPNRPVNIAPAAKFGLRQVGSDSITLANGKQIRINGRFPNGEMLLGIDPVKGVVETDRRSMVITPAEQENEPPS
jgi:hypothetical protein